MEGSNSVFIEYLKSNDVPIDELELTARAYNALRANGMNYLSEFVALDYRQLKSFRFVTDSVAREIDICKKEYLAEHRDDFVPAVLRLAFESRANEANPNSIDLTTANSANGKTITGSVPGNDYSVPEIKGIYDALSHAGYLPLEMLGLSTRVFNSLKYSGINSVNELATVTREELMRRRNLGSESVAEIYEKLDRLIEKNIAAEDFMAIAVEVGKKTCIANEKTENPVCSIEKCRESEDTISTNPVLKSTSYVAFGFSPDNELDPKKAFYSWPIECLHLSKRSFNALKRAGINTISDFSKMTANEIIAIRNIGKKSFEELTSCRKLFQGSEAEIIEKLERLLGQGKTIEDILAAYSVAEPVRDIVAELSSDDAFESHELSDSRPIECLRLSTRSLNALKNAGVNTVSDLLKMTTYELVSLKSIGEKSLKELEQVRKEYEPVFALPPKTEYTANELKPLVLDAFAEPFKGLSFEEIKSALPDVAKDDDIKLAVGSLLAEQKLEYVDFRCYKVYPSFYEKFESYSSNLKDRDHVVLKRRYAGETLERIAQDLKITRSRVQQIQSQNMRKLKIYLKEQGEDRVFAEDFYKPLFTRYYVPKSFWIEELALSQDSVYYLNFMFKVGTEEPEKALSDENVPISLRYRLRSFLDRDKLRIDGMLFPRIRKELEEYALKKYAQEEVRFESFVELYNGMLEANEIPFDEKLYYTESNIRSRTNRFSESEHCLWKNGERMRYYDIQSRDYTELIESLQLRSFHDTEVSTLKFINQYPNLMEKYDIHDAYELHNLLKKIADEYNLDCVHFSRQPILRFGEFNRTDVIKELIETYSPVTQEELVDYLYYEYGYDKGTAVGYLASCASYYHNGVYSADFKRIPESRMELLQSNLREDFYYIDEIKEIYTSLFENADPEEINPRALKAIGFSVNSAYAVQNYPTATSFFEDLLTQKDIIDLTPYFDRFGSVAVFNQVLTDLRNRHIVFLFEKRSLISMRKLEEQGVTEEIITDYCDSVHSFVDYEDFFTVYSLQKGGFSHALDQLGFDSLFYASLLETDTRFSTQSFYDEVVLFNGELPGRLTKTSFLISQLRKYESVDPDDFIEDISDRFGIKIPNRYEVISAVKDTELYYDSIMDKVYLDKSFYYDDLDE